jgi:hypothetical protein
MELLEARIDDAGEVPVGIAASSWDAHVVDPAPAAHRHGSGLAGTIEPVGRLTVHSLLRGPWEIRLATVDALEPGRDAERLRLRIGGWPVAADEVETAADEDTATASARGVLSSVQSLSAGGRPDLAHRNDASPLGIAAAVPTASFPVRVGETVVALVMLTGDPAVATQPAEVRIDRREAEFTASVTWPDGRRTRSRLTDPGTRQRAPRHHGARSGAPDAIAKEQHA